MCVVVLCWIDHVWSSKECVHCACDPNKLLPYVLFVFLYVGSYLLLWYVVLVCHQYDACENSVGSVYVGGYGGLSESGLSSVIRVQSAFL